MTKKNRQLMRATDAAQAIGVDASTLRRWCRQGKGPQHIKVGRGHYLFTPEAVKAWLVSFSGQTTRDSSLNAGIQPDLPKGKEP
jgi:excisionase family DNA binding protein